MNMAESKNIKEEIKKIIIKIKGNRNRPCYQNILTFYNRGKDEVLVVENIKMILDEMLTDKEIKDIGVDGKESFILNPDASLSVNPSVAEPGTNTDQIYVPNETYVNNLEHVEDYINDQFYQVLTSKIKEEVRFVFENFCNDKLSLSKDIIIENLENEIKSLKEQVATSNKIINLLSSDREESIANSKEALKSNPKVSTDNVILENHTNITSKKDEIQEDPINLIVTKKKRRKRNITVIGDSMIKDIEGFKMRNGMNSYEKVFVKPFSGATISCMHDYIKPTLKHNPDVILLHVGTNDLRSSKSAEDIANELINLSTSIKTEENEIIISNIILRNDSLNNKGQQVNTILKESCQNNNLIYCDNSGIIKSYHINSSGLHLKINGTTALANNFLKYINY